MLSVAASVSKEGTQLPGRYYPTPPHPTPPHPPASGDDAMLRKERSCQDVVIPPHPTASGDDAMLSVATSVSKEGTQLPGRYYPTPPHPPPRSCQDVIIPPHPTPPHPTPPPRIWRRCYVDCGRKCDADVGF